MTVQDAVNTPTTHTIPITVDLKPRVSVAGVDLSGKFIAQAESLFNISGGIFTDEDSTLTYELKLDNPGDKYGCGLALCDVQTWLTFTEPAATGDNFTLSGTNPDFIPETYDYYLRAIDSNGLVNYVVVEIEMGGKSIFTGFKS